MASSAPRPPGLPAEAGRPWRGETLPPRLPGLAKNQAPGGSIRKNAPVPQAMGREHRILYTSWCHPRSPRRSPLPAGGGRGKGRSLPGPDACGGPAGAFPPALADCLPLFRPHRFQPKGGALCTAGGQGTPVRSWRHQFCIVCVFRRNVKPGGLFSRSAAVSAYSPGWLCPGPDPLRSAPSSLPRRGTGSRWGSPSGCSWPAQWCLRRAAPALSP